MAITPTGAIYKALYFDGVSSRDFGVYITGEAVYNAPKREVEMISIPGRNGDLALDKGRFENIPVTYPAGIFANNEEEFAKAISEFRNFLCSRKGYVRLTDEYNADEYRMAVYKEGLEVDAKNLQAGEFNIVFNCKPQRWLTSGEELVDMDDWQEVVTESGEVVEFEATDITGIKSLSTDFSASQDGTPWQSETEQTPYVFRPSSGGKISHDYFNEFDTNVGGSVAWNQLAQNGNFADSTKWSATRGTGTASNNIYTYTVTTVGNSSIGNRLDQYSVPLIKSHKYIMLCSVYAPRATTINGGIFTRNGSTITPKVALANTWSRLGFLVVENQDIIADDATYVGIRFAFNASGNGYSVGDTIQFANVQCIDLTALFGSSTIADYLYSLEQATAGSGIAKLKEWGFDIDSYHAYETGSLESVNTSAHETVGFNQWDEEWEVGGINPSTGANTGNTDRIRAKNYIPVISGASYYFYMGKSSQLYLCVYDENKTYIGSYYQGGFVTTGSSTNVRNTAITMPSNAKFIRVRTNNDYGTTYKNDICVNISSDRNGEYEPYVKHSYPLDETKELRGIFYLDENNNLCTDGDIYPPSGQIGRRYKEDDLSSKSWNTRATGTVNKVLSTATASPYLINSDQLSKMVSIYPYQGASNAGILSANVDTVAVGLYSYAGSASDDTIYLVVPVSNTPSGSLVYEVATPTTETADPFTAIQTVDPYGTEKYVDYGVSQGTRDIVVPVGHKTTYAEVYSVDDVDYTYAYVSPTEDEEDATEYTMNLLGPRYGGSVEYVSGKISLTHDYHYVAYSDNANWTLVNQGNAQIVSADYSSIMEGIKTSGGAQQTALFDKFENSPIVKVGGANITNGALSLCFASGRFDSVDDFKEWLKATNIFVVYELATPEIVQQYGTEVEILDGTNYVWSANGDVTVEYGLVPGILINPTLFDAKPVLEVVGDGDIYIGEQNIEIADISYGELELISAEALDTGYEPFNETNYELLNAGDEIRVKAGTSIPVGIAAYSGVELNSLSLIISGTSGMTAHFESAITSYGHIYLPFVIDQDVVFHKGVESEAWAYLSVGISYRMNGQGYNYNGTAYFRIRLTNSPRYGWGMTITPLDNLTLPDELVRYFPSAQFVRKPIMGISTRSIIENPMIIDCDMGEAYTTDPNGNIVSLNSYIDLGSELPVLKPGITEITKDNTITDLKIKPRWWKI